MAKKWRQKLQRWITKQLDSPEDVMMDIPPNNDGWTTSYIHRKS